MFGPAVVPVIQYRLGSLTCTPESDPAWLREFSAFQISEKEIWNDHTTASERNAGVNVIGATAYFCNGHPLSLHA